MSRIATIFANMPFRESLFPICKPWNVSRFNLVLFYIFNYNVIPFLRKENYRKWDWGDKVGGGGGDALYMQYSIKIEAFIKLNTKK